MTTLLELPEIRACFSPLSVAEYHQLGEFNENGRRTELVRGIVIEKLPKSPLHCYIADHVRQILAAQITPEFIIFSQDPITTADSEPEPDVMVVRGTPEEFRTAHPTTAALVVEVAVTSRELDRAKAPIYCEAGVAEYWIVCPDAKQVEVYRQPRSNGYGEHTVITSPATIECVAVPGVRVDLTAIFA